MMSASTGGGIRVKIYAFSAFSAVKSRSAGFVSIRGQMDSRLTFECNDCAHRNVVLPIDSPAERNSLAGNGLGRSSPRLNRGNFETILNQFIPAGHRSARYAAWGIVLLVLVHLCWLQWRPGSDVRRIFTAAAESAAARPATLPEESFDRIARQAGDANVVLKLAGYARTNPAVENSLGYFYYRTAYALYPRRVYVAPADQVINDGGDILRAGFNPSRQWLEEHDVRSALTFGNDHAGGETPHLEILPRDDGWAGTPTNQPGVNQ